MGSTLTNLIYHVVFSTKKRAQLITPELREDLYPYLGGIIRSEGGCLLEIGGIPDHVHLLARFPPTLGVSDMVKKIKGKSSRWVNRDRNPDTQFGWQDGFAAFSVCPWQLPEIRRYIRNQERHHGKQTFKNEYLSLLERYGIAYDGRYVLD
jgi:REP element-mobilizing transposase RayT